MIEKIFEVHGWLDKRNGLGYRVLELGVTETDKCFICDGKRVNKNKLMVIDTKFVENYNSIRYHTYCKDGDQQKALTMIKQHIVNKVNTYKRDMDLLVSLLE